MRLHWLQVRRARGLPMPLPPKPKRPLGPPVLFNWNGIDVRTRSDIEKAGYTWDEFLDSLVTSDPLRLVMLSSVLCLVPPDERQDLSHEIRRRRMEHREREAEKHRRREVDRITSEPWFQRFLRRA